MSTTWPIDNWPNDQPRAAEYASSRASESFNLRPRDRGRRLVLADVPSLLPSVVLRLAPCELEGEKFQPRVSVKRPKRAPEMSEMTQPRVLSG